MKSTHANIIQIKNEILQLAKESGYHLSINRYSSAIDWLFDEKNKTTVLQHLTPSSNTIDFPDYFDLPTSISDKLTGDEVDLLQQMVDSHLRPFYAKDLNITQVKSSNKNKKP